MHHVLRTKVAMILFSAIMALFTINCHAYSPETVHSESIQSGYIEVTQSVPQDWDITENCEVTIDVKALKDTYDIEIHTNMPEEAQLVKVAEPLESEDGKIVWRIGYLQQGECLQAKFWVRHSEEGPLKFCTEMHHSFPMICTSSSGCRALLAIDKAGPEVALLNKDAKYEITVSNIGIADARHVVVTDYVPEEMSHLSGEKELSLNIDCIHPGESRTLSLCLRGDKRGKVYNKASAKASNAAEVSDTICTNIHMLQLVVEKLGTPLQYIGREAEYHISVKNTGDDTLNDVIVYDYIADGMQVVDSNGGEITANGVRWLVDSVKPGENRNFKLTLSASCAGHYCNRVKVSSCENITAKDEFVTEYRGHAAIRVETIDTCDPLIIGERTNYRIRIMNQGTAADRNIQVNARLSDHLKPIKQPGEHEGKISGQNIIFEPYEQLEPGESINLQVHAEAVQKGDGRIYVEMSSDMIKEPVREEESTQVY